MIQDLYAAHKDNRMFLHARFSWARTRSALTSESPISRWLWPDEFSEPVIRRVLKAKQKAIADYKKAIANAAGLAELMVFYGEQAAGFASDLGYQDESYFDALVRMFNQAVATANPLCRSVAVTF